MAAETMVTVADLVRQLEAVNAEMRRDRWVRTTLYVLMCLVTVVALGTVLLRFLDEFHEEPVRNYFYVCPTMELEECEESGAAVPSGTAAP